MPLPIKLLSIELEAQEIVIVVVVVYRKEERETIRVGQEGKKGGLFVESLDSLLLLPLYLSE